MFGSCISYTAPLYQKIPLELDLNQFLHEAIEENDIDVVASVLRQGAKLSELSGGISPLYRACTNGNSEMVRFLLCNGAVASQKNQLPSYPRMAVFEEHGEEINNATPIDAAVSLGNIELVTLLIDYQSPFDEPDHFGRTPLFRAVQNGNQELALLLIRKGANINVNDCFGLSLKEVAEREDLTAVLDKLRKKTLCY